MWIKQHRLVLVVGVIVLCAAAWLGIEATGKSTAPTTAQAFPNSVIPAPVSVDPTKGVTFKLDASATIAADAAGSDVAKYLAGILRASTGFALHTTAGAAGTIQLLLAGAPADAGDEGYGLTVTSDRVVIRANRAAGLFEGVQTLLQLLPPAVQSPTVVAASWTIPGQTIVDHPRFAYRGVMLDVARHFFTVDQVERYIDEVSHYKINYLHLHLSDDQGWRIAINGWPDLTTLGGSTEVGGAPGGYYTQADYSAIVAYAASRFITVIPEVDMPSHTNAVLASEPQLNCDGKAPDRYTGINVGIGTLCVQLDATYTFIDQVIGQLAALTPGPYIHIGGDESGLSPADYATFIDRLQDVVAKHGKTVIGWHNIETATLLPSTVAEFWDTSIADAYLAAQVAKGTKVIMAPASHAYLDMKYTESTNLGQAWAGLNDVNSAYNWNPGAYLAGVGEKSVLGVEAALWTETIVTPTDIDYMAFPRMPAIAELGWSPWSTHDDVSFDARLAAQGPRWKVMGIVYYHSDEIHWPTGA